MARMTPSSTQGFWSYVSLWSCLHLAKLDARCILWPVRVETQQTLKKKKKEEITVRNKNCLGSGDTSGTTKFMIQIMILKTRI